MADIVRAVGGEDVGEESKSHNDANQKEFLEEEENNTKEKGNGKDSSVELTRAFFVGSSRRGPL